MLFTLISCIFIGCEAQFTLGPDASVPHFGPRPKPTRPTFPIQLPADEGYNPMKPCILGDYIPGPTCTSFYMCTGSLYAAKKVKFECAPGTVFDDALNVCVHGVGSSCFAQMGIASIPAPVPPPFPVLPPAAAPVPFPSPLPNPNPLPPAPAPPPLPTPHPAPLHSPAPQPAPVPPPNPQPIPSPSPTLLPGPPSPQPVTQPVPQPTQPAPLVPTICSSYLLDPNTQYNCFQPGYFPSADSCQNLYSCTVSDNCTIKGTKYRCPDGFLFDIRTNFCQPKEQTLCQKF